MSEEEQLEALRKRKLLELQRRLSQESQHVQAQQQFEAQKQSVLRRILTTDARQRLTNLRMVKREFAEQLELQLIQIAQQGRIELPINDEQLKDILIRLQSTRRDIKIRRV